MRYLFFVILILASASTTFAFPPADAVAQSSLDNREAAARGLVIALNQVPDQHAVVWVNQTGSTFGKVVPLKTYLTSYGQVCREYRYGFVDASSKQQGFGTACRQSDGRWQVAGQQTVSEVFVGKAGTGQRCPHFSSWHPRIDRATPPQRGERYHSEEFLRRHQQQPKQKQQPLSGVQLVLN